MTAEDDLRLAWQAERDGRPSMRDALLTLAAAACGPSQADLAARCRVRLIASRPDHVFAAFPNLDDALADPRVGVFLRKLRRLFPEGRVRSLLRKSAVRRGPFTGRAESLPAMLDDLFGRPRDARWLEPLGASNPVPEGELADFSLRVLLGIAVLLECVARSAREANRAA